MSSCHRNCCCRRTLYSQSWPIHCRKCVAASTEIKQIIAEVEVEVEVEVEIQAEIIGKTKQPAHNYLAAYLWRSSVRQSVHRTWVHEFLISHRKFFALFLFDCIRSDFMRWANRSARNAAVASSEQVKYERESEGHQLLHALKYLRCSQITFEIFLRT